MGFENFKSKDSTCETTEGKRAILTLLNMKRVIVPEVRTLT